MERKDDCPRCRGMFSCVGGEGCANTHVVVVSSNDGGGAALGSITVGDVIEAGTAVLIQRGEFEGMPDAPPTRGEATLTQFGRETLSALDHGLNGTAGIDMLEDDEPRKPTAADLLERAAETYRERNALYGDNYRHFGTMMLGMFPRGLTLCTADDFARLGVFVQAASKLTRYAQNFERGGHKDSAHDGAVYNAMLEELTDEPPQ